jgi:4-hydroxy-2-oxoheptanedioate aldolase
LAIGAAPRHLAAARELNRMAQSQIKPLVTGLKNRMGRGEVVSSMAVRLVRTIEVVMIAKSAGFDSLYVDMEHSSLDLDATGQICMAAQLAEIAPFVRVPVNRPEYIARVLDAGACGIIAPDIRSATEAREVVAAAKYAPVGTRGVSGNLPHFGFRAQKAADMFPAVNSETMIIVQFESTEAVGHADEIAAVEGVDMVLIGTNDLMASTGIAGDFDNPIVADAYMRTLSACLRHGKHLGVGGLSSRADLVARFVNEGARYVSTGTDIAFLLEAATKRAGQVAALQKIA